MNRRASILVPLLPRVNKRMHQATPINLKGSEQHHKLKDEEGERGGPDHADGGVIQSAEIKRAVAEGMAILQ